MADTIDDFERARVSVDTGLVYEDLDLMVEHLTKNLDSYPNAEIRICDRPEDKLKGFEVSYIRRDSRIIFWHYFIHVDDSYHSPSTYRQAMLTDEGRQGMIEGILQKAREGILAKPKVTPEIINAIHDRLHWDGVWESTCRSYPIARNHPSQSIVEALAMLPELGTFVIISWGLAEQLLTDDHALFHSLRSLAPDEDPRWVMRAFIRNTKGGLDVLGYIGDIGGVPVVASLNALPCWGNPSLVTCAPTPKDIEYDGSNVILLR
jgi:hypothetical protein